MHSRATTPRPTRAGPGLRGAFVRALLVGVVATAGGVTPPASGAAEAAEPEVVPVLEAVTPAVPAGSLVTVLPDGALAVVNSDATPLVVTAPDGRDVARISARGVEVDAGHPFTYETRNPPGVPTRLPDGVAPGAPERWTVVSQDVSWRWHDPRTRPAGVRAPGGGRPGSSEVLATWSLPMRHGATAFDVTGRLELRRPAGWFRAEPDPGPDGVTMTVAQGSRPSAILGAPGAEPISIVGIDGEPFLRRTASGAWEAELSSRTYRLNLLEAGSPVPAGEGWRPFADPGPVSWTDERLAPPPGTGDRDAPRWAVPVLLDDRATALTGTFRYVPQPGDDGDGGAGFLPGLGLGAAVALLGAALGGLALRNRRLHAGQAAAPPGTSPRSSGANTS